MFNYNSQIIIIQKEQQQQQQQKQKCKLYNNFKIRIANQTAL